MVVRWDLTRERVYANTFSFPKNAAYEFTVLGVIVFDDHHIPSTGPADPNPDRMTFVLVALRKPEESLPKFACMVVNTNEVDDRWEQRNWLIGSHLVIGVYFNQNVLQMGGHTKHCADGSRGTAKKI